MLIFIIFLLHSAKHVAIRGPAHGFSWSEYARVYRYTTSAQTKGKHGYVLRRHQALDGGLDWTVLFTYIERRLAFIDD